MQTTKATPRYHFTMTGPDAGRPFCDCDKESAREQGDTFAHVSYSPEGERLQMARPDLCPQCRSAWQQAIEDCRG